MRKITIIALLCLTVLFGSCVKEDIIREGHIVSGKPAKVTLSLKDADMGSGAKTKGLTPEQEQEIRNIHVMIFDNKDNIVSNIHFDEYKNGSLSVPTYSGSGMTIFVVANGDANTDIDNDLGKVTTLADLYAINVKNDLHDLKRENGLLMSGEIKNVTIATGESSLIGTPIQLFYLSVKVTLKVIDNTPDGQSVQIIGWDIVDVPAKSYLSKLSNDAVNINTEDDFFTTDGKYPFDGINNIEKSATHEFYLFENRRGGRALKSLPADPSKRYPDMAQNDGDHRGKAWYAPTKATYIKIYAIHRSGGGSEQILAKIYLGENNHSDYNIARGNHYNFTVTVNGLNDINIDSNVDHVPGVMRVDYGTNLIMDAHPDFRPIRIQATKGVATIEILDSQNRAYGDPGFDATWLKISPLNLMYHQVKQSGANGDWQQAGTVGDFVRAKYIPHKKVREALGAKGGWNAVPVDKDDDDLMTLADATHRMCYKITDINFISTTTSTPEILCLYADEYVSEMVGTRTAQVRITYLEDGDQEIERETKILPITQRGPYTIFDMVSPDAGLARFNEDGTPSTGAKHKFVSEQFEEVVMAMNPGIDLSVQNTSTMQWGFLNMERLYNKPDKYRNGYLLTANAVYTDVVRDNNEPTDFSTLRPKYGNGQNAESAIIPNYGNGTHSGAPYYCPTATNMIYHPIYKSSAARYCHEKNRDLNGDGLIDASETKWYLPSQHELMMLRIANDADNPFSATYYWSATESYAGQGGWCVNFSSGGTENDDKSHALRVRCVREL